MCVCVCVCVCYTHADPVTRWPQTPCQASSMPPLLFLAGSSLVARMPGRTWQGRPDLAFLLTAPSISIGSPMGHCVGRVIQPPLSAWRCAHLWHLAGRHFSLTGILNCLVWGTEMNAAGVLTGFTMRVFRSPFSSVIDNCLVDVAFGR